MPGKKTLIAGLGNEILADDSIGPRLIKSLREILKDNDTEFAVASCGGLEMMELINGYKKAIIIDAIKTPGGEPGKIYYFTPSDFMETSNISNLHDVNFFTALHLGNILAMDLPSDLHIIAVEIIEDREFSENLSPALEKKYPGILEEVTSLVNRIIS